jgi:hypothetical protein
VNDFPTFDEIRTPTRKLLERDIQSTCVRWMRARGWWARKFASPANRSVPDYIFGKDGFTLFIEFKAPGKKVTEAQQDEHNLMLAARLAVHVIDNIQAFKDLVLMWEGQMAQMEKTLNAT